MICSADLRRLVPLLAVLLCPGPAPAQELERLESVELSGHLVDDKDRLLRFLGLGPGARFDADAIARIAEDLRTLGYRIVRETQDPGPRGVRLHLELKPQRVVRKIVVHGNWPLFDDEILRHLTVQSGSKLAADEELEKSLADEAARVERFLERDGYFGGSVKIVPRRGGRPDWVDLDVNLSLGDWYKLQSVFAVGNKVISDLELMDLFDHCCLRWGRFSVQKMREDARAAEKVLRDRGYPAARVAPDFDFKRDADRKTRRIRLPIKVTEKRKVEVRFVGNRTVSDGDLRDHLTIFSAGAYDEIELADSAKALQRAYQQRGFFEARVTWQRKRARGDDEVEEVTFFIAEGPELRVRGIDFASLGDRPLSFSADELRSKARLETKVFPRLGAIGLGEGGYVTSTQLEQDAERVVEFYRARGFPAVKVHAEVARDPSSFGALGALGAEAAGGTAARHDLYVRFFIDEGRHELVERVEVSFKGAHIKNEAEVLKVLRMTPGTPYTDEAFAADAQRIVDLYKTVGRPYVKADFGRTTWNEAHDRVVIRLDIDEGPEVRFGEILIRGNFKTRARVILADLPFKPGDLFDLSKLEEGERNLQTHLVFNQARVTPVGFNELRNPVPILVTVQERYLERFGSLALAGGIATDKLPNYVYVSAGWIWNNFFGFGSQLELRADFGFSELSYGASLRYTDIRAFGPGWRFDFAFFVRQELTFRLGPIFTYGLTTALTRYFGLTTRIFLRYDNYLSQVNVPLVRVAGPNDRQTVNDNTHTAKFTLGVAWDKRVGPDGLPNPLMPVKGWLLGASVGWAFPSSVDNGFVNFFSSENNFVVVSGQALGILPFKIRGAQFHLMANARYDHGFPIGKPALPAVERFYAGGDTTTRGFDTDQLKTEVIRSVGPLPGGEAFRVVPQGGNLRVLNTVEVQFPIAKTFLGLPWPWVGAVFWDMGAIANGWNVIQGSDVKHSVGLSLLRILTPVGPLSLEYAYPITQSLAEERWKTNPWYSHWPGRIHFNWGIPLTRL